MSRFTNFCVDAVAAMSNNGLSSSTMSSTAASKAHGLLGATVDDTLIET